jgi:hypothetical protein
MRNEVAPAALAIVVRASIQVPWWAKAPAGTFQSVKPQSTVQPSGMPLTVRTSSINWRAVRLSVFVKGITGA